jgi:hypothetical protein
MDLGLLSLMFAAKTRFFAAGLKMTHALQRTVAGAQARTAVGSGR